MRLLTKTLLYFIGTSLLVFLLGGTVFYGILKHTFTEQVDRDLLTEKEIIEDEIQSGDDIPDYSGRFGHAIEVIVYQHPIQKEFAIRDTIIPDSISNSDLSYRYLMVKNNIEQRGYSIEILQPLTRRNLLFKNVVDIMLLMFLSVMLFSVIINLITSQRLWLPFYETIRAIGNYDMKNKPEIALPHTNIVEFNKLNGVLDTMSKKIREDFFNLKELTENASHEIQTPLAIIKSKLELLVQSDKVTPEQSELIHQINQAVTRLSKLNAGLLLLTKIENNQYSNVKEVDIHQYLLQALENLDDFIKARQITLTTNFAAKPMVSLNPMLVEVLINNLINNAIKHNYANGFITIDLTKTSLIVSNSGEPLKEAPEHLFNRFKKSDTNSESLGLGLSICKKICDFHHMQIHYKHENETHRLIVNF